ncbi:MAG: hypothetical protein KJ626_09570 [Verrucomicrobia bacterium]|nr:hypothetical protein [Verrucomicrobiota bacterium]
MPIAFTATAHTAMAEARDEAQRLRHKYVSTEHLLLGLIVAGGGAVKQIARLGVDPDEVYSEIEKSFPPAKGKDASDGSLEQSPLLKQVIERARDEASYHGKDKIGTDHLLIGILEQTKGGAAKVLKKLGVDSSSVQLDD